jgi:hypothetical protein
MRTKRFTVIPVLLLVFLVLAASAAEARLLRNGVILRNPNRVPITVTYSWSGHFGTQGDV